MSKTDAFLKLLDEASNWEQDPQGAVDKVDAFLKDYPNVPGALQLKADAQELIDNQVGGKPLKSRRHKKGSRTKRTRTKRSRTKRMRTKRTRTKLSRVKRRGNLRRNTRRR